MKTMIKNAMILTAITLVAGILLGLVYEVTKEPIALAKEQAKKEAYQKVMSDADSFVLDESFEEKQVEQAILDAGITGCSVQEFVTAKAGEEIVGYVVTATSAEGYGGDIQVSVGILPDQTVAGIAILSIHETAGLGMKASEPAFYNQFAGKLVDLFTVTKTGASADGEIDALSGATITSTAVTDAVNAAVLTFQEVIGGGGNE